MYFKVMIPTLMGQIMMQYLDFINFFKVFLSHYKISFRKTGSFFLMWVNSPPPMVTEFTM